MSVFGWRAEDPPTGAAGTFTMLLRDGKEVAILCRQTPEARAAGTTPHWTSFISIEDADAAAAWAGKLGGAAVFREPFDVLNAGRVAATAGHLNGGMRRQSEEEGAVEPCWLPYFTVESSRPGGPRRREVGRAHAGPGHGGLDGTCRGGG